MKNIFVYASFLLLTVSISAQEAVKYPLLEHFTNTRCPICGARNPGFHAARANYGSDILHISYHPSAPYSSCLLHQHNPEGNDSRFDHYRPPGTPTVYLDGNIQSGSTMLQTSDVEAALQTRSFFELTATRSITGGKLESEVTITTRGEVPSGTSYKIYVAAVEGVLNYDAPNGESTHYNVFRAFLSDREGEVLSPASNGNSVSWTGSVDLHPDWIEEQMYILAFIENTSDGFIENAGSSLQMTTSAENEMAPGGVSIFPNPTSHRIKIEGIQVHQWELVSIMGTLCAEGGPLENEFISLAEHPPGPYILKLRDREGIWRTFKVIKTK